MEIITYNIWDLPLFFVKNRDKRMLDIAKFLTERKTDIICLQESWSLKHRALLSEYMRKHGYHDAVHQTNIKRNNGGLLTFSKFPITSVRFIPFGRWAFSISEIIGNKGVLETIIETPKGLIRILNVHLHYESSKLFKTSQIRLRQLQKLFTAITQDETMPTILAGDFNQHTMMESKHFSQLFTKEDFVTSKEPLLPTYRTENPLVDNWINRVSTSKRYDYILTKNITHSGFMIKNYTPVYLPTALSDHDPVSLVLEEYPSD
jgi:endonuclease/exonuclease/phosphatase family metal-dependent hydrolase